MKNLLKKEISLCLAPVNFLFFAFALMMLIPNYPVYVQFFYISLSIFFIFKNADQNRDIEYSIMLPIKKRDVVKARCLLIYSYEIVYLLITIPFAFLFHRVVPAGENAEWFGLNAAGIDINFAAYGFALIALTLFRFVYVTGFYKTADKAERSFLKASVVFWICYILFELPLWIGAGLHLPYVKVLDSAAPENLLRQLPILAAGIAVYVAGMIGTYKVSAARFEKVDL